MKIRIISFTEKGAELGSLIAKKLKSQKEDAAVWVRAANVEEMDGVKVLKGKLSDWTKSAFNEADAVIFIGAAGIAVRSIAPFVRDKYLDPAVIVIDEAGHYSISLLSGHVGGANALAVRVASMIGAEPVITTATDREGRFAVDLFAEDNGLACVPKKYTKDISAAVLAGERVGFSSAYPLEGKLPEELELIDCASFDKDQMDTRTMPALGVCVSPFVKAAPFKKTLFLVPCSVWLGIGCRKGVDVAVIREAVQAFLVENAIPEAAVAGVASCDLKKDEEGLVTFIKESGLPFLTFSCEELAAVEGEFTSSEFVEQTVGVDNVCERSAVAAAKGALIAKKFVHDGVTVAAAEQAITIKF